MRWDVLCAAQPIRAKDHDMQADAATNWWRLVVPAIQSHHPQILAPQKVAEARRTAALDVSRCLVSCPVSYCDRIRVIGVVGFRKETKRTTRGEARVVEILKVVLRTDVVYDEDAKLFPGRPQAVVRCPNLPVGGGEAVTRIGWLKAVSIVPRSEVSTGRS
jgi:hypothetical protein